MRMGCDILHIEAVHATSKLLKIKNMSQINTFKTSEIKISKDSQDYYTATHPFHGVLVDSTYFASRTEARREAVENLMDIKEHG